MANVEIIRRSERFFASSWFSVFKGTISAIIRNTFKRQKSHIYIHDTFLSRQWYTRLYKAIFLLGKINRRRRDMRALRYLPKGVTRGHVMQYTTMTEKITSIHAYC